jgi:hypothetical protein
MGVVRIAFTSPIEKRRGIRYLSERIVLKPIDRSMLYSTFFGASLTSALI